MARGRKKGGFKINSINDKNELTKMIINQINSLNKKIKAFRKEGIDEHYEYIKNIITEDMGKYTPSGTLSKSKKFYEAKNTVWLKKTLSALHKINNHEFYGTIRKYKKEVTKSLKGVQDYTKNYLSSKGYDKNFINEITNSKDFYAKLYSAFSEGIQGYGSDQIIEKIALSYDNSGMSDKEINKILSNIEYSKNVLDRLKEEKEAFEEFKRNRKLR